MSVDEKRETITTKKYALDCVIRTIEYVARGVQSLGASGTREASICINHEGVWVLQREA